MFQAKLIHDPDTAMATTLDQAILKLDALMKKGNANKNWAYNISNSAQNLEEKYHHDFIRYLANPAGYEKQGNIEREIEEMVIKTIPKDGIASIPEDLEQIYTLTKKGVDFDILVQNVSESLPEDDEKNPT